MKTILLGFFFIFSVLKSGNGQVEEFKKSGLVPDIVDEAPMYLADIRFDNGAKIDIGNPLTPTQVEYPPVEIKWETMDQGKFYLIIFLDPDAPSVKDNSLREWHHWIVGNVPGNDVSKGQILTEYIPSAPGKETGQHRYTYLIYEQPGEVKYEWTKIPATTTEGRPNFKVREFTKKYGISNLVAGNYYLCEYDESVPKYVEKMSG